MTSQILTVEDEPDIALAIETVLRRGGYAVIGAATGRDGLRAFHNERPDAVLLDVGLPGMDGWAVLDRIRDTSDVPVLMLTARSGLTDKVRGLHAGADDYLAKPFGNEVLLARVRALLRRRRSGRGESEVYDDGQVQLAFRIGQVRVDDQPVDLTPDEFAVLAALVRRPGECLTSHQLAEAVTAGKDGPEAAGPAGSGGAGGGEAGHALAGTGLAAGEPARSLAGLVAALNRKLGQACPGGSPVEVRAAAGYRYRAAGRPR
jgi:DNA-binding response OmpR family regulator